MNKHQVNAYLAVLVITIAGALAAWVIVRVAYNGQPIITRTSPSNEASYNALQQSILNSNAAGAPQP